MPSSTVLCCKDSNVDQGVCVDGFNNLDSVQRELFSKHFPLQQLVSCSVLSNCSQTAGSTLPAPYGSLLDHTNLLTPTLEGFYKSPLSLEVLERKFETLQSSGGGSGESAGAAEMYLRKVLLKVGATPVSFGLISVDLSAMRPEVRRDVEAETLPFGKVLQVHNVECKLRVDHFIKATHTSDTFDALFKPPHQPLSPAAHSDAATAATPFDSPAVASVGGSFGTRAAAPRGGHLPGDERPGIRTAYGRSVLMECDGRLAVRVLELLNDRAVESVWR
eukprot:GDKI01019519.1.p1 GENE.GDKI01019519.1~~GDKI01019519.1.p1  ORF type:complete len:276 (+),score=29.05 GDKI01019519.1:128-955(+)